MSAPYIVHPHTYDELLAIGELPANLVVAERISKEYALRAGVADALTAGYRAHFRRINGLPA